MDFYNYFPFHAVSVKDNEIVVDFENMPPMDLAHLDVLINKYKKENILVYEIGAWTGASTCCLASAIKPLNGRLVSIDNFEGSNDLQNKITKRMDVRQSLDRNLKRFEVDDIVEVVIANSNDYVLQVPDESIDFLFIDGDHRYSQVKKDLDNWLPKMKPNGIICGHDYNGTEYNEEFIEVDAVKQVHHGVIKAVNEKFGLENIRLFADLKNKRLESTIWIHINGTRNKTV